MCYCRHCQEAYRRLYGADIPTTENPQNKLWRDFLEFRYDSIARYLKDAGEALKSVNPDAIIYMNSRGLKAGWLSARDNRRLVEHQDIFGAEGGFIFYGPPNDVPWWKPSATARLLESQAGGKPTVVFVAGDHKLWARCLHTPSETRLLIAGSVANGASPWYGLHSTIEDVDLPGGQAAGEMINFLKDNERYYEQTEPVADIALLWSSRTADYYCEEEKTDFTAARKSTLKTSYDACFHGFCEMLLRLHVQFDIIDEKTLLEERLSRYKTVILPNCAILCDAEVQAVKKFVRSGGNLISSYETSLYDYNVSKGPTLPLPTYLAPTLAAKYTISGLRVT